MYETTRWNYHVRIFDSLEDLIDNVRGVPEAHLEHVTGFKNWKKLGRSFRSWEAVYAAAREPWAEGLAEVEGMARELEDSDIPKPVSRKRRMRWSEDNGDDLDLDKLRAGSPYWRESHRAKVFGPATVTLVIDLNAVWATDPHDILWRGAAALAMTHLLEAADYRVEIWTVHRAEDCYVDGSGHFHAVCLKRPGDPLDLATLVCAVSGWFYRTVMFRAKGIGSKAPKKGLGSPEAPWDMTDLLNRDEAIVISGAYSRWAAMALAREALAKLATPPAPPAPEWPEEEVAVASPAAAAPVEAPKPPTKAELRKAAAERRRAEREYRKWEKAWRKRNVESN